MEAEVLKIKVFEEIKVKDFVIRAVKKVVEAAKRIWAAFTEPEPEEPENENDDQRGPPDIGINVGENVGVGDRLG